MQTDTRLYIINHTNFKGNVLNTMPFVHKDAKNGKDILNKTYVHYTDQTFEEYNKEHNNELIALTFDEFYPIYDQYNKSAFCKDWKEISKDQYDDLLNCLPPCKWHDLSNRFNSFYIMEAYTADIHTFCIKDRKTGKYYSANRSRFITDTDLLNELQNINIINETLTT